VRDGADARTGSTVTQPPRCLEPRKNFRRAEINIAIARIAFILDGIISDGELLDYIKRVLIPRLNKDRFEDILAGLGLGTLTPVKKTANRRRHSVATQSPF
jgi:hypothetical protein